MKYHSYHLQKNYLIDNNIMQHLVIKLFDFCCKLSIIYNIYNLIFVLNTINALEIKTHTYIFHINCQYANNAFDM